MERIDAAVERDIGFDQMNRAVRDAIAATIYHARCAAVKEETYQSHDL